MFRHPYQKLGRTFFRDHLVGNATGLFIAVQLQMRQENYFFINRIRAVCKIQTIKIAVTMPYINMTIGGLNIMEFG